MKFSRVSVLTLSTLIILWGVIFAADGKQIKLDLTHAVQHISQIKLMSKNNEDTNTLITDDNGWNIMISNSSTTNFIIQNNGGNTTIEGSSESTIIGWSGNSIQSTRGSSIIAGSENKLQNADYSIIWGGNKNEIKNFTQYSAILWWNNNEISSGSNSTILWWKRNSIQWNNSIIWWTQNRVIWDSSVAIGSMNTVVWNNSFLWSYEWTELTSNDVFAVISDRWMVINSTWANKYAQLTIWWSLVIASWANEVICGNGNGAGIIKLVEKYNGDESNTQKCLCNCNGLEWNSINWEWICVAACKWEANQSPKCWNTLSVENKTFSGSCAEWEVIDASYYVDWDIVYWACQTKDWSIEICPYSLGCSGLELLPDNAHRNNVLLPSSPEQTYHYSNDKSEICSFSCNKWYTWNWTKCLWICNSDENKCYIWNYKPGSKTRTQSYTYTCSPEGIPEETCNWLCSEWDVWDWTSCVTPLSDICDHENAYHCLQWNLINTWATTTQYTWKCQTWSLSEGVNCTKDRFTWTIDICWFNHEWMIWYWLTWWKTALSGDISNIYTNYNYGSKQYFTIPAGSTYSSQRNSNGKSNISIDNIETNPILIDEILYTVNIKWCTFDDLCDKNWDTPGNCLNGATASSMNVEKINNQSAKFTWTCAWWGNVESCSRMWSIQQSCPSQPTVWASSCNPDTDWSSCILVSDGLNLNNFYLNNRILTPSNYGLQKIHCTSAWWKITCTLESWILGSAQWFKCSNWYTLVWCDCVANANLCDLENHTCNGYTPTNYDWATWKNWFSYKCNSETCHANCKANEYWAGIDSGCVTKPPMCNNSSVYGCLVWSMTEHDQNDRWYTRTCSIWDISDNCTKCNDGYVSNWTECVPNWCNRTTDTCNNYVSLGKWTSETVSCKKNNEYCTVQVSCDSNWNYSESTPTCNSICNNTTNPGSCNSGTVTRESGYERKSTYSYKCSYNSDIYNCSATCPSGQYRSGSSHKCVTKPTMCGTTPNSCKLWNVQVLTPWDNESKWKCSTWDITETCKVCDECYEEIDGKCTLKQTTQCQPSNNCHLPWGWTLQHGTSTGASTKEDLKCESTNTKCADYQWNLRCDNWTLYWKLNSETSETKYSNQVELYPAGSCNLKDNINDTFTLDSCPEWKACDVFTWYLANNSQDKCTQDIKYKEWWCAEWYSRYNGECCKNCGNTSCGATEEWYTSSLVQCTRTSDKCETASRQCINWTWSGSITKTCSLTDSSTCTKYSDKTQYTTTINGTFSNATKKSPCTEYKANNTYNRCEATTYYTYECNNWTLWNSTHSACESICNTSTVSCNHGYNVSWQTTRDWKNAFAYRCESWSNEKINCSATCKTNYIWNPSTHSCVSNANSCDTSNTNSCLVWIVKDKTNDIWGNYWNCYDGDGNKINTTLCHICKSWYARNSSSKKCEYIPDWCTFNNKNYNHGDTVDAFTVTSVACNQTCSKVEFTCDDGSRYYNWSKTTPQANCSTNQCNPGEYCKSWTCTSCECGTYSEWWTVTSCTACWKGKYSSTWASSCSSCEANEYCPNDKTCTPSPCPPGYSSSVESDEKSDCTITCDAGKYVKTADSQCVNCSSNYYSNSHTVKAWNTSTCTNICNTNYLGSCNFSATRTWSTDYDWKHRYGWTCKIGANTTSCVGDCSSDMVWDPSKQECVSFFNSCENDNHYVCNQWISKNNNPFDWWWTWDCYDGDNNKLNSSSCHECKDWYEWNWSTCAKQYSCLWTEPHGDHVQVSTIAPTTNTYRHTAWGTLNYACTWRCDSYYHPSGDTCEINSCQWTKPSNASNCSTAIPANNTTNRSAGPWESWTIPNTACYCTCNEWYAYLNGSCQKWVTPVANVKNASSSITIWWVTVRFNGSACSSSTVISPWWFDTAGFDCLKDPGTYSSIVIITDECWTCTLDSNWTPWLMTNVWWLWWVPSSNTAMGYTWTCCSWK